MNSDNRTHTRIGKVVSASSRWKQRNQGGVSVPHKMRIEFEQEADGRWIAEIPVLPGVMAYGSTRSEAAQAVKALALRVLADQIEEKKNVGCRELNISIACA